VIKEFDFFGARFLEEIELVIKVAARGSSARDFHPRLKNT